jgi:phosphoglycerol transferase MdoB-like AlkP superfamily enzyme
LKHSPTISGDGNKQLEIIEKSTAGSDWSESSGLKPLLCYLVIWVSIPSILRLYAIVHHISPSLAGSTAFIGGFFSGFFQDLLLGLEVYIFLGLVNAFLRNRYPDHRIVFSILSILLFSACHIYFFIDTSLLLTLGVRACSGFFYLFKDISPFFDSAKELGLFSLLLISIVAILISVVTFNIYFKKFETPRLNVWLVGTALAVFLISILIQSFVSPATQYFTNNSIIMGQYALISQSIGSNKSSLSKISRKDVLEVLPSHKTEDFSLLSEDFPLLKMTTGFKGAKNFNIKIDKDEKPHIIFLFLESFRAFDVGVLGSDKGATPVFDRISKEGALFTNFYSTGTQTTRAVISSLFGIMPRFTAQSIQSGDPDLSLIGIADILNNNGYMSAYFHNGSLKFESKQDFLPKHGYSEVYGKNDILQYNPEAEKTSWGIHDEYLMHFVADWLDKKDQEGQPAFLTIFTVSTHHPYQVPKNYQPPDFNVERDDPYNPFVKTKSTGKGIYKRYLETIHYADYSLGLLIQLLREKRIYEKSIIFILADDSVPMGEHHKNYYGIRYLYEENIKIPLLILAPGKLVQPVVVDQISSQVDLLPTVMDILKLSAVNHAIGTSLARKDKNRTVFFNNPFELGYLGIRKGVYKVIYTKQGRDVKVQIYNLQDDPAETRILRNRMNLANAFLKEAERVNSIFETVYYHRNIAPPISGLKQAQ